MSVALLRYAWLKTSATHLVDFMATWYPLGHLIYMMGIYLYC